MDYVDLLEVNGFHSHTHEKFMKGSFMEFLHLIHF